MFLGSSLLCVYTLCALCALLFNYYISDNTITHRLTHYTNTFSIRRNRSEWKERALANTANKRAWNSNFSTQHVSDIITNWNFFVYRTICIHWVSSSLIGTVKRVLIFPDFPAVSFWFRLCTFISTKPFPLPFCVSSILSPPLPSNATNRMRMRAKDKNTMEWFLTQISALNQLALSNSFRLRFVHYK